MDDAEKIEQAGVEKSKAPGEETEGAGVQVDMKTEVDIGGAGSDDHQAESTGEGPVQAVEGRKWAGRTDEQWDEIRAAYMGGMSTITIAKRFKITRSYLQRKITKEKWKKARDKLFTPSQIRVLNRVYPSKVDERRVMDMDVPTPAQMEERRRKSVMLGITAAENLLEKLSERASVVNRTDIRELSTLIKSLVELQSMLSEAYGGKNGKDGGMDIPQAKIQINILNAYNEEADRLRAQQGVEEVTAPKIPELETVNASTDGNGVNNSAEKSLTAEAG